MHKYLDIIKKSLSLYKDADKYSLDGYVYMLRTSAMIYEPEGMDRHFTWFGTLLDELSEVDFAAIDSAHFVILQEKMAEEFLVQKMVLFPLLFLPFLMFLF